MGLGCVSYNQRRSIAPANGQCACLSPRPHLQAHFRPSADGIGGAGGKNGHYEDCSQRSDDRYEFEHAGGADAYSYRRRGSLAQLLRNRPRGSHRKTLVQCRRAALRARCSSALSLSSMIFSRFRIRRSGGVPRSRSHRPSLKGPCSPAAISHQWN